MNGVWLVNGKAYPNSFPYDDQPMIIDGGNHMFLKLDNNDIVSFDFKKTYYFSGQYDYRCTLHGGESGTILIR